MGLQHFTEFGVVMMLFLIGLEMQPKVLWAMRARIFVMGGLQVGRTTGTAGRHQVGRVQARKVCIL